jgi:hypothetical protein
VLGGYAAQPLLNRMTDKQFYKITQRLLWVIGAIYLMKAAALAYNPA